MKYYIYILYSKSSDKFYVGFTNDYLSRLTSHNSSNRNTFTSKYRPWELKAVFETGDNRAVAMELERFIKKQKSRAILQKLINPDFVPNGKLAQLVRVPQLRN